MTAELEAAVEAAEKTFLAESLLDLCKGGKPTYEEFAEWEAFAEGRIIEYHIEQDRRRLEQLEEEARELERQAKRRRVAEQREDWLQWYAERARVVREREAMHSNDPVELKLEAECKEKMQALFDALWGEE